MKALFALLLVSAAVIAWQNQNQDQGPKPGRLPAMGESAAVTYESLAKALLELRTTEKHLVRGMLTHYAGMAARYLELAASVQGARREYYLQMAAVQIDNLAHEGAKEVRPVRARLLEAGHRHHTDPGTKEDYMFISSSEKKALLVLTERIGKLTRDTPETEIRNALLNFVPMFEQMMASE